MFDHEMFCDTNTLIDLFLLFLDKKIYIRIFNSLDDKSKALQIVIFQRVHIKIINLFIKWLLDKLFF
jgi:hypothetical protein